MEKINENQRFYTSHWWWSNILEKRYEQIGISLDHCAVRFNQQLDHWDILILVALDLRVPLRGHDKGTSWQGRNWKWHGDCMSIGNVEDCLLQSWSKFKYESYRFIPIIPVLTNRGTFKDYIKPQKQLPNTISIPTWHGLLKDLKVSSRFHPAWAPQPSEWCWVWTHPFQWVWWCSDDALWPETGQVWRIHSRDSQGLMSFQEMESSFINICEASWSFQLPCLPWGFCLVPFGTTNRGSTWGRPKKIGPKNTFFSVVTCRDTFPECRSRMIAISS